MNFGFIIDNRKCIGCHACTVACKSEHDVPVGVNRTWVKYIEKGEFPDTRRLFSVMRCNHCADAPCVDICPTEALHTRKDGIVDFDDRRCISCKACTQACPYDALYIHPETKTAAKCNYCTHRVDIGLEPACVVVCPEHAIISGDMDNPDTEISKLLAREPVSVRKAEKGTNPKLFYIDGDNASLEPGEAHPDTEYMWSSQSSGVGKYARYAEMRKTSNGSNGLVQIEGRKKPKRVYDAPSKGMLWGWEVSAYILTKAIAAGAFIVPVVASSQAYIIGEVFKQIGAIVAMIFLSITGLLLIKDLGRPDRFLYVLLRPQWKSWLTRGAYIITGYGAALTAWLAASFGGFPQFLPAIEIIGLIFAVLSAVYTAFLFAQAKGRDLWQSPMLGLHMIVHSLMAGLAVFLIAGFFLVINPGIVALFKFAAVGMILIHLVTLAIELVTPHGSEDAHKTVKMITSGKYAREFWIGMVLFGNVLPAALLFYSFDYFIIGAAGLLVLVGLYVAQVIWVKAPQEIALS
ncbi:MAG: 4Fe-4S ferredoxin [Acidobacteria bacterium]|nr:MAG: 4Fe-4S ferredoxin [Acidobacteriota bacterium]REK01824.1 MAG: 4Fe-4S ferredoxin [Acidobacteriota bacterium]REK14780.1 MAG: 4Fe-4S ferredoxin [Acidobacteriota bacterium]REK45495.1 MAG: 4Fe-4S ferredoxin [Acidobacteriota bacterium]